MDVVANLFNPTAGESGGVSQNEYEEKGNPWILEKYPDIDIIDSTNIIVNDWLYPIHVCLVQIMHPEGIINLTICSGTDVSQYESIPILLLKSLFTLYSLSDASNVN